jgi:hypothetical protein
MSFSLFLEVTLKGDAVNQRKKFKVETSSAIVYETTKLLEKYQVKVIIP